MLYAKLKIIKKGKKEQKNVRLPGFLYLDLQVFGILQIMLERLNLGRYQQKHLWRKF